LCIANKQDIDIAKLKMKLIYQGQLLNNDKQLLRDALKRHPTPLNDPSCIVALHLVLHESPQNMILIQEQTRTAREDAKEAQTIQHESLLNNNASSATTGATSAATTSASGSTRASSCCLVM